MRILVTQQFNYNDPHTNEQTVFTPGVHSVTEEVANHWFTQFYIDTSFVDIPVVETSTVVSEPVEVTEPVVTTPEPKQKKTSTKV